MGIEQEHRTKPYYKCMGQGHGTRAWGRTIWQEYGASACDEETGHGQGHGKREIEKGIGVWTMVWDKGKRKGQGHGTIGKGNRQGRGKCIGQGQRTRTWEM